MMFRVAVKMPGKIEKSLMSTAGSLPKHRFAVLKSKDIILIFLSNQVKGKIVNRYLFLLVIILIPCMVSAQTHTDEEIALVFSGGGARGAYEIGAWKALSDLGFKISGVYGSSVGSINGPAIIMDDYKKVRDLWFKTTYLSVMELSQPAEDLLRGNFRKLSFKDYITVIKELWADGGIDVTPLKELLTEVISEEEIRSSKIDYGLVIFSVSNLEPEMLYIDQIPQGELIDYILASSNFPLFKRQEINGEVFIDGGVYSNVPIEMALKKGFKDIVIVDIGLPTPVDIVNYFTRNTDDSFKFTFIRPREHYGSSLNFEPEISKKYLVEGYLDTMQVYGYLQGEKYYIYGSEDMIKEMFDSLNTEKQEEALSILGVDENDNIKDLYSGLVLPVFKSALWTGYNDKTGYVSLNILEELAKMMGIEPLSVYTQKELLERINDKTESNRFNYPIIGFINRWRYERIINFLEYLVINAGDQIAQPEGYDNFINQLNALLE